MLTHFKTRRAGVNFQFLCLQCLAGRVSNFDTLQNTAQALNFNLCVCNVWPEEYQILTLFKTHSAGVKVQSMCLQCLAGRVSHFDTLQNTVQALNFNLCVCNVWPEEYQILTLFKTHSAGVKVQSMCLQCLAGRVSHFDTFQNTVQALNFNLCVCNVWPEEYQLLTCFNTHSAGVTFQSMCLQCLA